MNDTRFYSSRVRMYYFTQGFRTRRGQFRMQRVLSWQTLIALRDIPTVRSIMRIVSWNMNARDFTKRHGDGWTFLLDDLEPDIALLQEVVPPSGHRAGL